MQPKIITVKWLPFKLRGATLPPFGIFIKTEHVNNEKIINHDLIHWKQYKRMGLLMYYFRYIIQLIIIGYDTMPMEMEARQEEKYEDIYKYREIYHK
jgi:hypothetical protein